MKLTLYGIPNCGTVKKARAWLEERDVPYTFVDYRAAPPSEDRVRAWVDRLGAGPLRNTSGGAYRALPDDKKTWADDAWVRAFAAEPMLIRRPVFELDDQAVMAGFRKPDQLAVMIDG